MTVWTYSFSCNISFVENLRRWWFTCSLGYRYIMLKGNELYSISFRIVTDDTCDCCIWWKVHILHDFYCYICNFIYFFRMSTGLVQFIWGKKKNLYLHSDQEIPSSLICHPLPHSLEVERRKGKHSFSSNFVLDWESFLYFSGSTD